MHEFESQPGVKLRFYLARPIDAAPKSLHLETVDAENLKQQLALAQAGFAPAFADEFAVAGMKTDQPISPEVAKQFAGWIQYIKKSGAAYVTFAPRGVGYSALTDDKKHLTQTRRRFMLLGQTQAGMQVWDVRRATQAVRQVEGLGAVPLHFHASPAMTEVATFAAVFEPGVTSLTLANAPRGDKEAPDFLNWSRILTPRQLLQLAQDRCQVILPTSK